RVWEAGEAGDVAASWSGPHFVVLCGGDEDRARDVAAALTSARCVVVGGGGEGVPARYEAAVLQTLELLQRIVAEKPKDEVLIQLVVAGAGAEALFGGLAGLLRTARLEHPKLRGQIVVVAADESAAQIVAHLQESARRPHEQAVRYSAGTREVASWRELSPDAGVAMPWRDGGVYLITGGAGGLGLIFAEAIARGAKDAVIVLTGRSELDDGGHARLSGLERLGARVAYRRVDVADGAAVRSLIAELRESHGGVSGIIHAAGVIRDSFLLKKTADEIHAVLAPKVAGVVNLDEATADLTLEFMILFGSGAGAFGNVGQADYAAANALLAEYAAWRNEQVRRGERWGRTVSIAWPLWRDGGMQLPEASERQQRQMGLHPLATEAGLEAFYRALAGESGEGDEIAVLSGEAGALR
ncbi:KR domain-containing protein, partial [Bradyrhizobium sp. OK095]